MMLPEKMARQMYAKNRERIIQHVQNNRGSFVVNFYKNSDMKISADKDDRTEFYFNVPNLLMRETLDAEFNKSLTNYLTYGKNHE